MLKFFSGLFGCFSRPSERTLPLFDRAEQKLLTSLHATISGDKIKVPIASLQTPIYKPKWHNNQPCLALESNNASKGEKLCMQILSKIYKKPFYRVRPDFLKNPETGRNLELDIFNSELGIACEYNGKQHYAFPSFPGHTRKDFIKGLCKDLYKIKTCKKLGIYLIVVPYTVKEENMEEYIRSRLPGR
ncbi:Helicase nuclease [Cedratvirus Zaza IHUMI]|uniref:Helicase nuclease n=1 Tax=Cedratvirus Zaza IHUMI TaxID=2126979 RepID=A0A2R8FCW8_9VIRU|nr:Helicase nuclease [Cedratvirus Zaza IHUMI]